MYTNKRREPQEKKIVNDKLLCIIHLNNRWWKIKTKGKSWKYGLISVFACCSKIKFSTENSTINLLFHFHIVQHSMISKFPRKLSFDKQSKTGIFTSFVCKLSNN